MLKKAIVVIKLSFILLFSSAFVLVPQVNRRTATQTLDSALEDKDETFMRLALRHAQHAFREKEVPIGAVVVEDDTGLVLATSRNRVEATQDPTAHAEVNSIRAACGLRNNWRLSGCTLYTTLEPCPMCLSTAMAARVNRVVFGAHDPRLGAAGGGGFLDLPALEHPFHTISVKGGVLQAESQQLMTRFFRAARRRNHEHEGGGDGPGSEDSVADFRDQRGGWQP